MPWTDRLRDFKFIHWIYNLLHYQGLKHNREAYRKYHIHKPLIASISSRDFPDTESRAWLDQHPLPEQVVSHAGFSFFPRDIQEQLLAWPERGYLVWKNFFPDSTVNAINQEIGELVRKKKIRTGLDNKLRFTNRISGLIREITLDSTLTGLLGFILDKPVVPFQTLNFLAGSSQRAHSDSIHMTTYPLGYLIAAWIALEDTSEDNGPLFYYPGSHSLPFLLNRGFKTGESSVSPGRKDYRDYENEIEQLIREKGLRPEIFLASPGDLFIWHANLLHGGMPIRNPALTRKSMVIHYYAADVIKYHEITERPSVL
jgi:ectoine hydroxylase